MLLNCTKFFQHCHEKSDKYLRPADKKLFPNYSKIANKTLDKVQERRADRLDESYVDHSKLKL